MQASPVSGTRQSELALRRPQSQPLSHRSTSGNSICVVNASCASIGNSIYSFGGFHFVSDVVYNDLHVLNLTDLVWRRVDHIRGVWPCKRTDHSMSPWGSDRLVLFGGSDTNETFLNDVFILHLKHFTWEKIDCMGALPSGRAKHSAVIFNDRLIVSGGCCKKDEDIVDEINVLDLRTYIWEPPVRFVRRQAHTSWVHRNRLYVYGGFNENLDRVKSLSFYDLESGAKTIISTDSPDAPHHMEQQLVEAFGRYLILISVPVHWRGAEDTVQMQANGLWALDIDTLRWRRLADGRLLQPLIWHYHVRSQSQLHIHLLGENPAVEDGGFMSHILTINLELYGIVPARENALASDMAALLNMSHLSDFSIASAAAPDHPPIPVHRIVLIARWPYFSNLVTSGMSESSSSTLTLPEPIAVLRAFIEFLYTDTIPTATASPGVIAEVMTIAHRYCLERLQRMCCAHLLANVTPHDAIRVFLCATRTCELLLRERTLNYILANFGNVVRSADFTACSANELAELWQAIPKRARIVVLGKSVGYIDWDADASSGAMVPAGGGSLERHNHMALIGVDRGSAVLSAAASQIGDAAVRRIPAIFARSAGSPPPPPPDLLAYPPAGATISLSNTASDISPVTPPTRNPSASSTRSNSIQNASSSTTTARAAQQSSSSASSARADAAPIDERRTSSHGSHTRSHSFSRNH